MTKSTRILFLTACSALSTCSVGLADLGTCLVLRGSDSGLDGKVGQKASAAIYEAHSQSDDSDQSMVFVLTLRKSVAMKGCYSFKKASLTLGGTWTLRGYEVTASDAEGIQHAVAEIKKAFEAGRIGHLKLGKREWAEKTPHSVQP